MNNKELVYEQCAVNIFLTLKNLLMLNWLRKDALLACKRCPLSSLLTPFCRLIKHLLKSISVMRWYQITYEGIKITGFLALYLTFIWLFCNYISRYQILRFKVQTSNSKGTTNYANCTNHWVISIRVISVIRSCSIFVVLIIKFNVQTSNSKGLRITQIARITQQ